MDEILFLNFGNTSNYVNTHFWNLNDEIFKLENSFNLDQSKIYSGESNLPLTMIFDFSENIHPYRLKNIKITQDPDIQNASDNCNVDNYISSLPVNSNNFIKLLNDDFSDEEKEKNEVKNEIEAQVQLLNKNEVYKLEDNQLYEYMDFDNNIKNWNDFCQPIFSNRSFNEIKTIDLDTNSRNNYFTGQDIYKSFGYNDEFEDNARHFVEKCGKVSIMNFNVDYNTCWGGLSNKVYEYLLTECPKSLFIFNGYDTDFDFENEEKILNYLFYFTDILNEKTTSLFQTSLINENRFLIDSLYNIKFDPDKSQSYNFYLTSVLGASQQNLYIPYRSLDNYDRNYFNNLIITNNMNFFDSNTILPLSVTTNLEGKKNSGVIMNFNQRIELGAKFSWKNFLIKTPLKNVCIINGFNEKYTILQDKIDLFLIDHSMYNFINLDSFRIPICFPKNYYIDNKKHFMNSLNIMNNYRSNFTNKDVIKTVINYVKQYKLKLRNYLTKINKSIDEDTFEEINDRIETLYNVVEVYTDLASYYKVNPREKEEEQD